QIDHGGHQPFALTINGFRDSSRFRNELTIFQIHGLNRISVLDWIEHTNIFNFYNSHDLFLNPQSLQSNPVPEAGPALTKPTPPYVPQFHWSPDSESPTAVHRQYWSQSPPHGSLDPDASRYNPVWPSLNVLCSGHTSCRIQLAMPVPENQSAHFEYAG